MNRKSLLIIIIISAAVVNIIISGCMEEKPENPLIIALNYDSNITILTHQDEEYDTILNESMRVINSANYLDLLIPEKIKNGSITETYVDISVSKPIHVLDETGNFTAEKIIIILDGRDAGVIYMYNGKSWDVKDSRMNTDNLHRLVADVINSSENINRNK